MFLGLGSAEGMGVSSFMERFYKAPKGHEWDDDFDCDDMLGPEEFLSRKLPETERMLDMSLRRLQLPVNIQTRELLLEKIFPDFFVEINSATLIIDGKKGPKVKGIQVGHHNRQFTDYWGEPLIVPDPKDLNDALVSLDPEIADFVFDKFDDLYEEGKISRLAVLRKAWVEDEDLGAIVGKEEEARLIEIFRREGEMRHSEMMEMEMNQGPPRDDDDEDEDGFF